MAHVEGWFPNLDLDPNVVADTINGIYYGVKQARKQFELAREQLAFQQAQAAAMAESAANPPTLADAVDEELRRGDVGLSPG